MWWAINIRLSCLCERSTHNPAMSDTDSEDDTFARALEKMNARQKRTAAKLERNANWKEQKIQVKKEPEYSIPILAPMSDDIKVKDEPEYPIPDLPPMFNDEDVAMAQVLVPTATASSPIKRETPLSRKIRELESAGFTNKQLKDLLGEYKGPRLPAPSKYKNHAERVAALAALQLGLPLGVSTPETGSETEDEEDNTPITNLFGQSNVVMRGTPAEEEMKARKK